MCTKKETICFYCYPIKRFIPDQNKEKKKPLCLLVSKTVSFRFMWSFLYAVGKPMFLHSFYIHRPSIYNNNKSRICERHTFMHGWWHILPIVDYSIVIISIIMIYCKDFFGQKKTSINLFEYYKKNDKV
jgi:hypothetical protein